MGFSKKNYLKKMSRRSRKKHKKFYCDFIMIVCLDSGILRVKKLSRRSHIIESI